MQRMTRTIAFAAAALYFASADAVALEIAGVDTVAMIAALRAGNVVSTGDVSTITSVDIQILTLAELTALLEVLKALRSANYDVEAPLVSVADRIAFLETVAEDRPIPASPT